MRSSRNKLSSLRLRENAGPWHECLQSAPVTHTVDLLTKGLSHISMFTLLRKKKHAQVCAVGNDCPPPPDDNTDASIPTCTTLPPAQMLKLIAKFVGKPRDESELAFVTNPKAQKFMEDLPEYPPADLRRRFPSAGADAVDLLARMLVMRPDRRLSVDEALRHPYLRSLRDKKVLFFFFSFFLEEKSHRHGRKLFEEIPSRACVKIFAVISYPPLQHCICCLVLCGS